MSVTTGALAALQADELIDDQALSAAGDDAFRLTDFVTELVALCEQTALAANIALFAAWGSGKSSLANLLEQEFAGQAHEHVAFARFDAFKYAEIPLRRHLLSQLAKAFRINAEEYGDGLYQERKTNTYDLPWRKLWEFAKLLGWVSLAVIAVTVGVAAIVGLIADTGTHGAFAPAFKRALEGAIPSVLFASGLLAALVALAGQTFTVESTRTPPSTEEEFDRLFAKLVGEIVRKERCERVVIFVDELDRCSPGQVVTVLETLKTFLDIRPCVFIVAADKHAIEQALGEQARQATPGDVVNPYYSAGSAYLDKIFQHQLSLPPLLSRTLSQFALRLVAERPGAWAQIENKAELVTVLVPSHVRSPRRVKVLLNSFVLAYRLACRRAADGALEAGVAARASEIAKLVCLRTEFPRFAEDLRLDARMGEVVLRLADDPDLTLEDMDLPGFTPQAFARARAFVAGDLALDTVIARTGSAAQPHGYVASGKEDSAPGDDDDDEGEGAESEAQHLAGDSEPASTEASEIVRSQSRQLTAYLRRTEAIPGPGRDLVFLESSGAAFGLPAELADTLEQSARDGASRAVLAAIKRLEANRQPAALHLLCSLARESLGVEVQNVCGCLLTALGSLEADLDSVVDDVLVTLGALSTGYQLGAADLPGVLEVALLRQSPAALELRQQVLERPEAQDDPALGLLILWRTSGLGAREERQLGPVLAARMLGSEADEVFEAIEGIPDEQLRGLIEAEEETLLVALGDDAQEGKPDGSTIASALAERAVVKRPEVAPVLLTLLLKLDTRAGRDAAEPLLERIAPIEEPSLVRAVLQASSRRYALGGRKWLGALAPEAVEQIAEGAELLDTALVILVHQRLKDEEPISEEGLRTAIALLSAMVPDGESLPAEQALAALEEATGTPALDNAQAEGHAELHALAVELAQASLIPAENFCNLVIADVVRTLEHQIVPEAGTTGLPRYVLGAANLALPDASVDQAERLLVGAADSPWLPVEAPDLAAAIALYGRSRQRQLGTDVEQPLSVGELQQAAAVGRDAEAALAAWMRAFTPQANEIVDALAESSGQRAPGAAISGAIATVAADWGPKERQELFMLTARAFVAGHCGRSLVSLAGEQALDGQLAAEEIAELFDAASNNIERERALQVWAVLVPVTESAARLLISRVYIPMLSQGKGAARIALTNFALVSEPPSKAARDRIRAAIKEAARGDKTLERQSKGLMQNAGWERRPRFRR